MPELPPIADTVPGVDVRTWGAFFAPVRTPAAILDKLHREITRIVNSPETRKILFAHGFTVEVMGRSELRNLVTTDIQKHSELVRATKMPLTD